MGFSLINHTALGVPLFQETSIWPILYDMLAAYFRVYRTCNWPTTSYPGADSSDSEGEDGPGARETNIAIWKLAISWMISRLKMVIVHSYLVVSINGGTQKWIFYKIL